MVLAPETAARTDLATALLDTIGINHEAPEFEEGLFARHAEEIITGGVRAGKSTTGAARVLADAALKKMLQKPALYWIIGPDYPQTREEFRYLTEWNQKLGWMEEYSAPADGPRHMKLRGGIQIETKSAMYPERLGSVAPDGILVVEAGQCSDEIRRICIERSMEKAAWIVYTGTLEDTEATSNHQRWAWYSECAEEWMHDRTLAHGAYALPSWANRVLYGSCESAIRENPAYAEYCPDENHGTAHSGRNHPAIRRAEAELDPYTFARRIAAEPVGLQFQIYPQLDHRSRLAEFPVGLEKVDAVGGIDYGTTHPSALAAVTIHPKPVYGPVLPGQFETVAWVREVCFNEGDPGDVSWLRSTKAYLAAKYGILPQRWGTDPNEKFMARNYQAESVAGSAGAREYRIGLVTARLNADALFFDLNGPGVKGAYEEGRRYHRAKSRSGQLQVVREKDDRIAAIEDAVEIADGSVLRAIPKPARLKYRRTGRVREFKRL